MFLNGQCANNDKDIVSVYRYLNLSNTSIPFEYHLNLFIANSMDFLWVDLL